MSPCRLSFSVVAIQIFVSSIGGPNPFLSRWWFPTQTCFIFIPKFGEDETILTNIFFNWVEI